LSITLIIVGAGGSGGGAGRNSAGTTTLLPQYSHVTKSSPAITRSGAPQWGHSKDTIADKQDSYASNKILRTVSQATGGIMNIS